MKNKTPAIKILTVRDQKVVLDVDLAHVYGVTTKRLNEQFRRNRKRFPKDFAFRLTAHEADGLRSQIATASRRDIRYWPWAFTEHGALQAANILRSDRAIAMSVGACPERSRTGHPCLHRAARKSCHKRRNP